VPRLLPYVVLRLLLLLLLFHTHVTLLPLLHVYAVCHVAFPFSVLRLLFEFTVCERWLRCYCWLFLRLRCCLRVIRLFRTCVLTRVITGCDVWLRSYPCVGLLLPFILRFLVLLVLPQFGFARRDGLFIAICCVLNTTPLCSFPVDFARPTTVAVGCCCRCCYRYAL